MDAYTTTVSRRTPEVSLDSIREAIFRCEAMGRCPPAEREISYAEYMALLSDPRVVSVIQVNAADGSIGIHGVRLKIVS